MKLEEEDKSFEQNSILENEFKIMTLFIDNAKTYTQLAGAGLALSVVFIQQVFGLKPGVPMPLDKTLVASWACFLLSIGAGVYYQYLAVKYLEVKAKVDCDHFSWPKSLIEHPYPVYLTMILTFYAGAVLFTIDAIKRLSYV
ncbi:MAG: hypothetical protein LUM44_11195 [Pyrinomonadaceae bacterium]|nr:hypothetical protein [Pyrinomonadaceae bacterium]